MTVWQYIVFILAGIITTPLWMIGGVMRFWKILFDHPTVVRNVQNLLTYSNKICYGFHGDVVICTNKNNPIYSGTWNGILSALPTAILRMKVNAFWIEDNELWIKILINDKLMADLEKELSVKKEEQMRVSDDA